MVNISSLWKHLCGTSHKFADWEADLLTFGRSDSQLSQDSCALDSSNRAPMGVDHLYFYHAFKKFYTYHELRLLVFIQNYI